MEQIKGKEKLFSLEGVDAYYLSNYHKDEAISRYAEAFTKHNPLNPIEIQKFGLTLNQIQQYSIDMINECMKRNEAIELVDSSNYHNFIGFYSFCSPTY